MKCIPNKELIHIIEINGSDVITKEWICKLFDYYGDDYFKESSYAPFEKTVENENRKRILNNRKYGKL